MNRKLELMKRKEKRLTRLRLEREKKEYEEQRAERMRRAYDEQAQKLENQRREIRVRVALEYLLDDRNPTQYPSNFQRAYPPSVAVLNDALTTNQSPLHEPLPPTLVPNPLPVWQNLLPQEGNSFNWTTVMNFAAMQPQTTVSAQLQTTVAGVAVNLRTNVNSTTAVSTAIPTAQPYIPP